MLGWPTTVPRLAAVVARHAGDLAAARRRLDHAIALCDREDLAAERAKVLLEMGRTEAAAGAQTVGVAALFAEAVRAFNAEAMHGWVAHADVLAQALGFSVLDATGRAGVHDLHRRHRRLDGVQRPPRRRSVRRAAARPRRPGARPAA